MTRPFRFLLVPGGGGSGPDHWHHRWAEDLPSSEWVHQADSTGGTREDWVATLDRQIRAGDAPVVLIAHSLGCIAVAHWALGDSGRVAAALLVAPADIDDDWAEPGSLYKRFQPIPMTPLPFPATVVASTNDPLLSTVRAGELATAWSAELVMIGDHLHVGSDAVLDRWPEGRFILDRLLERLERP